MGVLVGGPYTLECRCLKSEDVIEFPELNFGWL